MRESEASSDKTADTGRVAYQAELSFGLMRIGGALLALPVEAIREVVPGQKTYAPLAAWAKGIIGAINLRGLVIPIFDARSSLGMPTPDIGQHVILILRLQGRLLGLIADEVCGMARLPPHDLFALDAVAEGSRAQLTSHVFKIGDDVASLLDATRISALPNLPTVIERTTNREAQATNTEKLLLFSFGQRHFGIEATGVDATVPHSNIERNPLATGYCLGVINHQFYATPVVETSAALGFALESRPTDASVVVVRFVENAMLGFVVDEVREIATVVRDRILPMPNAVIGATPLFRGIYTDDVGREHLILDMTQLRNNKQLSMLAHLRKPKLGLQAADAVRGPDKSQTTNGAARPFLTYVAGGERATLLTQITEILSFPNNIIPYNVPKVGIIGLFTHQDRTIPLICIATSRGHTSDIDPARSRVLIATDKDMIAGFVVDSLKSIESATWNSPAADREPSEAPPRDALVMIGAGEQRRMVHNVDLLAELHKMSRTMHERAKAAATSAVEPPPAAQLVPAARASA